MINDAPDQTVHVRNGRLQIGQFFAINFGHWYTFSENFLSEQNENRNRWANEREKGTKGETLEEHQTHICTRESHSINILFIRVYVLGNWDIWCEARVCWVRILYLNDARGNKNGKKLWIF